MAEEFEGRDLSDSVFWGVDLRRATFRDVNLSGVSISHALLDGVDIDAKIDRLVINGVDVTDYVNQRDRWYPLRAMVRPADPEGARAAWAALEQTWAALEQTWAATIARADRLTDGQRHERVDGEWSFAETLRNLLFAMDKWFTAPILGEGSTRSACPTRDRFLLATAITGTLAHQSASSPAPSFSDVLRGDHGGTATEADGALPNGATVFDDRYPGVANLDLDLLRGLREAATDAADDGIDFYLNSGWRSPEYQNQLLREAVSEYGSEEEAARWVASADTSPRVSGDTVDIGHSDATAWLSEHGAQYGLCQIYRNEPWHYELRPQAINHRCPRMYADPTHDPRMQR